MGDSGVVGPAEGMAAEGGARPFPLRRRAYEPLAIPFRSEDIPAELEDARHTALFVVHGMGLQRYPETAVTLRSGCEDAIAEISLQYPNVKVPPPYIYEGYWADYADFPGTFPEYWGQFEAGEQEFFRSLWLRRSVNPLGTGWWFVRQNLRLWWRRATWRLGLFQGLALMAMAPLTVAATLLLLLRRPKVLAEVLGDARIYCDPRGDVEEAIVQRIDRRVGERFLKLLGLDWDFRDLPEKQRLRISGRPYTFTYVTWCAHSLGTLISCNVIGDLFQRAEELREELAKRGRSRPQGEPEPGEDLSLRENIAKVERGLHRFVTFGSPLQQIECLFSSRAGGNTVLREWPEAARQRIAAEKRKWWVNFYHVWDPVSAPLHTARFKDFVNNQHGRLLRLPLVAHGSYWRDIGILKYVVSRAFGEKLCRWPDPKFLPRRLCVCLRFLTSVAALALVLALLVRLGWWLLFGGLVQTVWRLLLAQLGI